MSQDNPVSDKWANRIIEMWKFYTGLRGDNLRRTGDTAYIGSGDQRVESGANRDWRPQQFRVKSEENDYLVCVPYSEQKGVAGEREYKIAKPTLLRSGDATWTIEPAYVPDSSVIWAGPLRGNGVRDSDNNDLLLVDLNIDGRRSDLFWARIDASAGGTNNQWQYDWTEMERLAEGWQVLAGGRTNVNVNKIALNSIEANNTDSGVEGNSIDVDGAIFTDNTSLAMQGIRGTPIVRMRETALADGNKVYTIEYVNAIDGTCG